MTPDLPASDDDRQIDLLVDGELSDDQRQSLLASLDSRPDGWRRCALAFLEAQAWCEMLEEGCQRSAVRFQRKKIASQELSATAADAAASRAPALLALAACLLVAFCLGAWFDRGVMRRSDLAPSMAWQTDRVTKDASPPAPPTPAESEMSPDEMVLVLEDPSQPAYEVRVPLLAASDFERAWPRIESLAPEELLTALEEAGHDVRRRRFWAPLRLDDGRSVLLPVEELDVLPAGHRVYQ